MNWTDVPFYTDYFAVNAPEEVHGDKILYWRGARAFANFEIYEREGRFPVGTSLYLVPLVWLFGDDSHYDITNAAFIMNTFVLYSIALVFVCLIGSKIFSNRKVGLFIGLVFVFFPWIFYWLNYGPYGSHSFFVNLMWLASGLLTDTLSAVLAYILFFMALRFLMDENVKTWEYVLFGALWGYACLVRETNFIFIFAIAFIMLRRFEWKKILLSALMFIIFFLPQMAYNYHVRGRLIDNGFGGNKEVKQEIYLFEQGTIARAEITPANILYMLTTIDKYIPFLPVVLVALIFLFVVSAFYFYRNISQGFALLFLLWLTPFTLLYMCYNTGARAIRYWHPVIPHYMLIVCGVIGFAVYTIKKLKKNAEG